MSGSASAGAAYPGSLYQDDIHDFDYVEISAGTLASPVGATAVDFTVDGGSVAPFCPNQFTMKIDALYLINYSAGTVTLTVQRKSSASSPVTVPLLQVPLATKTGVQLTASLFKLLCYPTWKFQLLSDTAASGVGNALVRLTKGAGQ